MGSPPYIFFGGGCLPPPPYTCNGTRFVAHIFVGKQTSLQIFVDRTLNTAGTPGRFKVLSPFVIVMGIATEAIGTPVPPYCNEGTAAETDMGFYIPVIDGTDNAIVLQPAYMLVDNWFALAGGREIWGFPKALGTIEIGAGHLQDAPMRVSSLVIEHFLPNARPVQAEVFRVDPPAGDAANAPAAPAFTGTETPGEQFVKQFQAVLGTDLAGAELMISLAKSAISSAGIMMALLRQYRRSDAEDGTIFSAILRTRLRLIAIPHFGILGGGFQLTLAHFDSMPIDVDLGIDVGSHRSVAGVWADIDFQIDS